jgi:anti-sigma factor ChrR (cupin superfamily)
VESREEIAAEAALFVLGQLDPEASARFEAQLQVGSEVYLAELNAFSDTAAALGSAAPTHSPPPALRDRLMARIAQPSLMQVVRHDTGWLPGPAPGVEIRLLHQTKTMMVKLAPGARIPPHHHHSAEQCLVIEGRLTDGKVTVEAGDFVYMPAGSTHSELWSETGCKFLIAYA